MVRQYASSFRPAWAVTVPAPDTDQPKTEALNVQATSRQEEPINGAPAEIKRDIIEATTPRAAYPPPPLKSKTSTVRSYAKVFPSSWSLPSNPDPPPTAVIDFGNPDGQVNALRVAHFPRPHREGRQGQYSAESGEADASPRRPEASNSASYPFYASGDHSVPYPPTVTQAPGAPWGPRYGGDPGVGAQRNGYPHSLHSISTPYSVTSASSAGNDVPARAPCVSPSYSEK